MRFAYVGSPTRPGDVVDGAGAGGGAASPGASPVYAPGTRVRWAGRAEVGALPTTWSDPGSDSFAQGVLTLVTYRLGKYRQPAHPLARLVPKGSGADAMALKLAARVVARERRRASERGPAPAAAVVAVVACDKLSEKVKAFVSDHVHALERSARAAGVR